VPHTAVMYVCAKDPGWHILVGTVSHTAVMYVLTILAGIF
jgi:hypothetical protein